MKMRFRKIMAAILSTAMVAAAIPAAGILNVQAKSPQEHIDLSRQVAGEGMVLMENDGALPLAQGEKVAMFGRASHSHNPPQYSHIVGLSSHFYAHIWADPKVFHPLMSKLMWI